MRQTQNETYARWNVLTLPSVHGNNHLIIFCLYKFSEFSLNFKKIKMKLFFLAASVNAVDNFTVLESHKLPTAKYEPAKNRFQIDATLH